MPVVELNAFSAQLQVLQAQESLRRVNEIGVGTGSMEKADQNKITRSWQRDAGITSAMRRSARGRSDKARREGRVLPLPAGIGTR